MGRKNSSELFGNILYTLMSNFSLSYYEALNLPLPVVFDLLKRLERNYKKLNKKMRGRKHG